MELEIICWRTKDKIIFDNINGAFQDICNKEDETYYYTLENHKLKIINTNIGEISFREKYINKCNNKKHIKIIILKEANDESISVIKSAIEHDNVMVVVGKINLCNYMIKENKDTLDKLVYLPQLSDDNDEIDIKVILHMILGLNNESSYNINEIIGAHIILGVENENNMLGNIPLFILKRFNYICRFNKFKLNIINEKELDLNELIYIEDPLREYMDYNDVLIIKQYPIGEKSGRVYFFMIAK